LIKGDGDRLTITDAGIEALGSWEPLPTGSALVDYKVIMLSNSTATLADEEHAGALDTFMMFFGDVMSTDEAIARLVPVTASKTA
jgi:nicotinamidase-related amidase